ncbi:DUF6085 family protein [Streptomyces sp. NPDC005892]|uniref:DUF6085 family protein n=1 Tax=Streptomyces sp. NPDC005892 TaxID=3155593 RepID=UPI00340FD219
MPDVQGCCPACGGSSLFLGEGGHVTCSRLDCPNPCVVDDLLHGQTASPARADAALRALVALARRLPDLIAESSQPDRYALAPPADTSEAVTGD